MISISVPVLLALVIGFATCFGWSRASRTAEAAKGVLREEMLQFSASVDFEDLEVSETSDFYDDGWAHIVAEMSFRPAPIDEVSSTIRHALESRGYVETTPTDAIARCRWQYARTVVPSDYGMGNRVEFIFQFGHDGCPKSAMAGDLLVQGNPPAVIDER